MKDLHVVRPFFTHLQHLSCNLEIWYNDRVFHTNKGNNQKIAKFARRAVKNWVVHGNPSHMKHLILHLLLLKTFTIIDIHKK